MKHLMIISLFCIFNNVACEQLDQEVIGVDEHRQLIDENDGEAFALSSCDEAMEKWNSDAGNAAPGDPCDFNDTCIDANGDQMRCVESKFIVACGITNPAQEPTFLTDGGTCDDI